MTDTSPTRCPSGRFLLRLDPALHGELRDAAAVEGVSLNEYCARKLAAPEGGMAWGGARGTVDRAAEVAGDALVAVAVYGSWARREARAASDVDVLVVVERDLEIRRQLYGVWDEEPVDWDGREVEPHFVHLPQSSRTLGGLWGEVALDGLVLFDPALRLAAVLAEVRRGIAEGRLVRSRSHGQPYWVRGRRMHNLDLAADHLHRARVRLRALDVLFEARSWADVVRESQEIVELSLQGVLRVHGVDPPRVHDVSAVLLEERDRVSEDLRPHLDDLAGISRSLRRDRELAFYGAEDLTPSDFYRQDDAQRAREGARRTVELVEPEVRSRKLQAWEHVDLEEEMPADR